MHALTRALARKEGSCSEAISHSGSGGRRKLVTGDFLVAIAICRFVHHGGVKKRQHNFMHALSQHQNSEKSNTTVVQIAGPEVHL